MEKHIHSKRAAGWTAECNKADLEKSDFFEVERQVGKTAEMIIFSLVTGTQRAFPVLSFDEIKLKPESGITLYSRTTTITIMGRNLEHLYSLLTLRKIKKVSEYTEEQIREDELWIESIGVFSDYEEH